MTTPIFTLAEAIAIAERFDALLESVVIEYAQLSGEALGACGQRGFSTLQDVAEHIHHRENQIAEYRQKIFHLKYTEEATVATSFDIRKIALRNGVAIK